MLVGVTRDGSEQSISVNDERFFSSKTGVRFPQTGRQLSMKVDETTISDCVPMKIDALKATSSLCVCVSTCVGGLV